MSAPDLASVGLSTRELIQLGKDLSPAGTFGTDPARCTKVDLIRHLERLYAPAQLAEGVARIRGFLPAKTDARELDVRRIVREELRALLGALMEATR